jgi:N-glycosylase/DNA lyase
MLIPLSHPFDLAATINSGQVFHWHEFRDGWLGTIGDEPIFIQQTPEGVRITPDAMASAATAYFALDHDFTTILGTFPQDDAPLAQAVAYAPGLRIMRQPLWECLATFITSSLKQVPHIRQISLTLRRNFGFPVPALFPEAPVLYTYPTPEAIAAAGEEALRACGLGYRAAFLHRTAIALAQGEVDLSVLSEQSDDEARATLMRFHGVGEKIANCVLLFACGRLASFPIDVWIERVLRQFYFARKRKVTPERIRKFAAGHFGSYAGYAQQFLFHLARMTKLEDNP